MFLSVQFYCEYPGCKDYILHFDPFDATPVHKVFYASIANRNLSYLHKQHNESTVDHLAWLTFVFPRFEDFYREALRDLRPTEHDVHYEDQFRPPKQTFCQMNVPHMVGPTHFNTGGCYWSLSQDQDGVCSWDEEMLQEHPEHGTSQRNWTFTCPEGPGSHFRSIHVRGDHFVLGFNKPSNFSSQTF